jgi:hypothetical protein
MTASPPDSSQRLPRQQTDRQCTTVTMSGLGFKSHATVAFSFFAAVSVTFDKDSKRELGQPLLPRVIAP